MNINNLFKLTLLASCRTNKKRQKDLKIKEERGGGEGQLAIRVGLSKLPMFEHLPR